MAALKCKGLRVKINFSLDRCVCEHPVWGIKSTFREVLISRPDHPACLGVAFHGSRDKFSFEAY